MASFDEHPSVRRVKAKDTATDSPRQPIASEALRQVALECGADDCGLVAMDDPALVQEREHVLACFPATRMLLVIICQMHGSRSARLPDPWPTWSFIWSAKRSTGLLEISFNDWKARVSARYIRPWRFPWNLTVFQTAAGSSRTKWWLRRPDSVRSASTGI